MKSKPVAMTSIGLLLLSVLVVGVPYSFFIYKACHPAGVSEFVSAVGAFHTLEGC